LNQLSLVYSNGIIISFSGMMDAVLKIFEGLVFILDGLFDFCLNLFNEFRLERRGLKNSIELSLFLFLLLELGL